MSQPVGYGCKAALRPDPFATLLRQERLAAGMSLRELAWRSGKSLAQLSALERAMHQPTRRTRTALLRALTGLGGGRAGQ